MVFQSLKHLVLEEVTLCLEREWNVKQIKYSVVYVLAEVCL